MLLRLLRRAAAARTAARSLAALRSGTALGARRRAATAHSAHAAESGSSRVLGAALFLVPAGVAFYLSWWQWNRRSWKLDLIAKVERIAKHSDPVPLQSVLESVDTHDYTRVTTRGTYLHHKQIFVGPRSAVEGGPAGFFVVTPFRLEHGDSTVLVVRGWVPKPTAMPTMPLTESARLTGVLRKGERATWMAPSNDPDAQKWTSVNEEQIAAALDTDPILVYADAVPGSTDWPRGGQVRLELRNEHLQYSLTWLGLGLGLVALTFARFRRGAAGAAGAALVKKASGPVA